MSNKRLVRTRHEWASLLSCVVEPLKRNVPRLEHRETKQQGEESVIYC